MMRGRRPTWLLLVAPILLTLPGGCGVDYKVGNGGRLTAEETSAVAAALFAVGDEGEELARLSAGLDALAPSFDELVAEFGFAGAPRTPGLVHAAASDDCARVAETGMLPPDAICSYVVDEAGSGELVRQRIVLTFWFPYGLADTSAAVAIDAGGERWYRDGSTSVIDFEDLEAPTGTTEADVFRHRVEIRELRVWPEGKLLSRTTTIQANFRGKPDDAREPFDVDEDDLYYELAVEERFRDGKRSEARLVPATPVRNGEDAAAGIVTRTTTYPEGHLVEQFEELRWDRPRSWARGTRVLRYADATTAYGEIQIDGDVVAVLDVARNGRRERIRVDRSARTVERILEPAADDPVAERIERGSWHEEGTRVALEVARTTRWRDGGAVTRTTWIERDALEHSTTIRFTEEASNGDRASGNVTAWERDGVLRITASASDARGRSYALSATRYVDGSAELDFELDLAETERSPDAEAHLVRAPDGTLSGYVVVAGIRTEIAEEGIGDLRELTRAAW